MKNVKKNNISKVASVLISLLLSEILFEFFSIDIAYSEVAAIPMAACLSILFYRFENLRIEKMKIISWTLFSMLLSVSFVIGRKISLFSQPHFAYFELIDVFYFLALTVVLFAIVVNLQELVCNMKIITTNTKLGKKIWGITFLLLIICWMPYLLVGYPGVLSPDSFSTINQSVGVTPYNNHHPILFTLFGKVFIDLGIKIGGYNFGVACFSFAQMTVLAATLSYAVFWLRNKGVSKYIVLMVFLFFALNPVIAVYSITMWKDVLFGGWMLLFILHLYDIVESKGELLKTSKGLIKLAVITVLVSFARNNGFYVVVAVLTFLALCFIKYYKTVIPVALSVILAISVIQGPVYEAVGIASGNFAEAVGIPIQQIAYTVSQDGELTDEQREFVNKVLPEERIIEQFRPYSPDFIKFHSEFNNEYLNENKLEFLLNWASILPKNFKSYVKAWLMQTVGYYHIPTNNWVVYTKIDPNSYGIKQTNLIYKIAGLNPDEDNEYIKYFINLPIVKSAYNIALSVWLTFFACIILMLKKKFKHIIVLTPLIMLWATMMIAAPTYCEFRYMFSFHLALPFIIIFMLIDGRDRCNKNVE